MTPERYQLVKRIFLEVCRSEPADRAAVLERECSSDAELRSEVQALLATDEQVADFLSKPPSVDHSSLLEAATRANEAAARPASIGPYRIIDVLGEGGMGVVYLAEQDNPRRQVALKIIRPGIANAALLKRFDYEAQLLGRLQHRGIAQIYQAGTADTGFGPQPFFAMELVRGKALNDYASLHNLSTRDRLELLVEICEAVHHAHQKGIIHRDLKPGNILVEHDDDDDSTKAVGTPTARMTLRAQPKILDFGVARATDAEATGRTMRTTAGELIGTIAYMSPEQVGGDPNDIDIRTDVYALGVIFYELLSGRKPHNLAGKRLPESVRIVQEEAIKPLGTVNKAFRGDLETIVGKALEKDRARRYQSALDLAEDARRFLTNRPIAARPPSTIYRIRKFTKRNKSMVFWSSIAAATGIFAGSSYFVQKAANEDRMVTWMEVRDELSDPLRPPIRNVEKLRDVSWLADDYEGEKPEQVALMRNALGLNFMKLASYDEARKHLTRALEIRKTIFTPPHADLAVSHTNLARLMWYEGRYADAITQYMIALEMRQALRGEDVPPDQDIALIMDQVATCYRKLGQGEVALEWATDALTARRRIFGENHWEVAASRTNVGMCTNELGRHAEAAVELGESLTLIRSLVDNPSDDLRVAGAMTSLADCLIDLNQLNEADHLAQQSLDMKRRGYPEYHPSTAATLVVLARLREKQERLNEAEQLCREALSMQEATQPATHIDIAATNVLLGEILLKSGRPADAEQSIRRALAILTEQLPADHRLVVEAQTLLDQCATAENR